MTTALQITTGAAGDGAPRLTAVGEIDLSNADDFAQAMAGGVGAGRRLLVDLTGVEYLDSAALAVLFTHADDIAIRISPLNETLLRVCGLADLTEVQVVDDSAAG
jgi:anti-sigma B factor antagonist